MRWTSRPDQAQIDDLGGAFHMMPSSRGPLYRWMLLEKQWISHFCGIKSTISLKTGSDGENVLPRIHEKIISRDTNCPFGRTLPEITPNRLACQALRTSPGILHIGEISERRHVHPLMMCFEIINLIISEVPSPTVLSLESRQCLCTSNSSA